MQRYNNKAFVATRTKEPIRSRHAVKQLFHNTTLELSNRENLKATKHR